MQIGMIGLGRMGANMVRRLQRGGHQCVVFDKSPDALSTAQPAGAVAAASLAELVRKLEQPRAIWMMVPGAFVEEIVTDLVPHLAPGDILIDGGNSYYVDDIRIAKELAERKIYYVDCGTSGGVMGLERGYCLMIGGPVRAVKHLEPRLRSTKPCRRPYSAQRSYRGSARAARRGLPTSCCPRCASSSADILRKARNLIDGSIYVD